MSARPANAPLSSCARHSSTRRYCKSRQPPLRNKTSTIIASRVWRDCRKFATIPAQTPRRSQVRGSPGSVSLPSDPRSRSPASTNYVKPNSSRSSNVRSKSWASSSLIDRSRLRRNRKSIISGALRRASQSLSRPRAQWSAGTASWSNTRSSAISRFITKENKPKSAESQNSGKKSYCKKCNPVESQ